MNHVTLAYAIYPLGASQTSIQTLMQAVPIPPDILQAAGLRAETDVTALGNPVVRTILIAFGPSATATATAVMDASESGEKVRSVTVTAPGDDYILPPQVSFAGGLGVDPRLPAGRTWPLRSPPIASAYLKVQALAIDAAGTLYSAGTVGVVLGAMAPPTYKLDGTLPPSCVQNLRIAVQGKGYSPTATIQFDGTLDPTDPLARPAQAVITAFGPHGEILGVQLIDPGQGYIEVPKIRVIDKAHAGGGFMVVRPNPITGAQNNPTTTSSKFIVANIGPVMGQGTPATVTLAIGGGGAITGAVVATNGARYIQVPQIFIFDPLGLGSGGVVRARMGVGTIEVKYGGKGFGGVPAVVLTPYFKTLFPDGSDQRAMFRKLLKTSFAVRCLSPVQAIAPVLT